MKKGELSKTTQKCSGGNTEPQSVEIKRSRNFVFTLNNYSNEEFKILKELDTKYIVIGEEIGDSGTPHLQGYVEFKDPLTFTALKKRIGKRCHVEPRKGTSSQASDYCKKDGNFFENGEISSQGARADLNELKDSILNGSMTVDDITIDDPVKFHQYGRTLNKLEDLRMRKVFRTEMTVGIWYYGDTGVGKSHKALEGFTPDTHYMYPYDNGWWDGYKQQDNVVINEFRGEIKYAKLLDLVDKWPTCVKRRNREPMPFVSKNIIITSSKHPKEVYGYTNPESGEWVCDDNIDQLYRRFKIIKLIKKS